MNLQTCLRVQEIAKIKMQPIRRVAFFPNLHMLNLTVRSPFESLPQLSFTCPKSYLYCPTDRFTKILENITLLNTIWATKVGSSVHLKVARMGNKIAEGMV